VGLILVVQIGIDGHFIQVLLIIHRRTHDFAGVGDGAKQAHIRESFGGSTTRRTRDGVAKRWQHRNENIVLRKGITAAGQLIQSRRHVAYSFVFDEAEPIFVKLAESHE
jgi:hypothetical protein